MYNTNKKLNELLTEKGIIIYVSATIEVTNKISQLKLNFVFEQTNLMYTYPLKSWRIELTVGIKWKKFGIWFVPNHNKIKHIMIWCRAGKWDCPAQQQQSIHEHYKCMNMDCGMGGMCVCFVSYSCVSLCERTFSFVGQLYLYIETTKVVGQSQSHHSNRRATTTENPLPKT